MTMTLLAVAEIWRKRAAVGSRRCIEASKHGSRCTGNLVEEFGFGGGERKGGVGNSWKFILVSSRLFVSMNRSLAWWMWVAEQA